MKRAGVTKVAFALCAFGLLREVRERSTYRAGCYDETRSNEDMQKRLVDSTRIGLPDDSCNASTRWMRLQWVAASHHEGDSKASRRNDAIVCATQTVSNALR